MFLATGSRVESACSLMLSTRLFEKSNCLTDSNQTKIACLIFELTCITVRCHHQCEQQDAEQTPSKREPPKWHGRSIVMQAPTNTSALFRCIFGNHFSVAVLSNDNNFFLLLEKPTLNKLETSAFCPSMLNLNVSVNREHPALDPN